MSETFKHEENEQDNEAWDQLAESVAQFKQKQKEAAPERAKRHFQEIRAIEMDFAKRNDAIATAGEKMTQKEFERWEDAIADEMRPEVMQSMVAYRVDTELSKTIEARAGDYYTERDKALRTAIKESGRADAEKDLAYLNGFFPVVARHLDFKYMTAEDVRDYGSTMYESQRTKAHNDTIRYLNGLNRLAQKYGTRAFVARDFWTSDLCDKKAQTPAVAAVMRYDRDIVEEYYAIAFSSEVRKRKALVAKANRYGF